MNCPDCKAPAGVIDSRHSEILNGVRRRRKCSECGARFTTLECVFGDLTPETAIGPGNAGPKADTVLALQALLLSMSYPDRQIVMALARRLAEEDSLSVLAGMAA
jgi:hypothetical protein